MGLKQTIEVAVRTTPKASFRFPQRKILKELRTSRKILSLHCRYCFVDPILLNFCDVNKLYSFGAKCFITERTPAIAILISKKFVKFIRFFFRSELYKLSTTQIHSNLNWSFVLPFRKVYTHPINFQII